MVFRVCLVTALVMVAVADLRMASQPKNAWKAIDRGKVKFVPDYAYYMEPSDFNYAGLKKQRDQRAYDQFLRSNIDNEQDKRNFKTEPGRDHLPFRSYETAANDSSETVKHKLPAGKLITATPGKPFTVPLRWNNPHASELEVNIWIMKTGTALKTPVVVPIRKPTCSGEGYQDNVFQFIVPLQFNQLGASIPNFKGCKAVGDCVLQIYAHSVESRTYAIGTPLIVTGDVSPATATNDGLIGKACEDVGTGADYKKLRPICRPSNDPDAHINTPKPAYARMVSDVATHAYANSDFSPYSGQQCKEISQNLQASAILKMVPGNRGELGKRYWGKTNKEAAQLAKKLDKKARNLIRVYESMTNQVIAAIGEDMGDEDTTMADGQKTNKCFRCAQVGSTTTRRLTTNTYIPSFEIPNKNNWITKANDYIAPMYKNLITCPDNNKCVLQIYSAVLRDMEEEFLVLNAKGGKYLPAVTKTNLDTKTHPTQHRKQKADGSTDNGEYASEVVFKQRQKNEFGYTQMDITAEMTSAALAGQTAYAKVGCPASSSSSTLSKLLNDETTSFISEQQDDMDALMLDNSCDDDQAIANNPDLPCHIPGYNQMRPGQLFAAEGEVAEPTGNVQNSGVSVTSPLVTVFALIIGVVAL